MDNLAARAHDAVAAVCPILGVRIGKRSDRSTWEILFAEAASAEQKAAAQAILDSFAANEVPATVSRFQAKAALMQAGLYEQVEAAIAGANDPLVTLAWNEALSFERGSPTIAGIAQAVGLSDAQVDDLFRAARAIVV
jgi:hypothetical protein